MRNKLSGNQFAALACGAAVLLAGCGTTTTRTGGASTAPQQVPGDGAATTPTTTARETRAPAPGTAENTPTTSVSTTVAVWDACSLSESALSAAELDTATRERISNATFPAWRGCKWQSADRTYELFITSYDRPLEVELEPARYQDIRRTQYYGRAVVQYRAAQDTHKQGCYVGTAAAFGSIEFLVHNTRVQTDVGDPCADANRVGATLFKSLP
ncbi:DUF3558 family protein [Nocardia nepalensis]|uniref:DUF3558 family protein n=1 Tax=Nocardia nepalensis TaxID=3375448 RepID=UPI003B66B658